MARLSKSSLCRSRRAALRSLTLGLALIAAACATSSSAPGQDPFAGAGGGGAGAQQIRIRVRNDNFYDATLTAIGDGGRRRLGTVGGNQSAVYTMPWTLTGGLRIEIDLLAGPTCTTDYITVGPGEDVQLEITPDLDRMPYCR